MKQFCVLLVDDERRILKFLEIKLSASGYRVLTAGSGLKAIELVRSQEPDLVVLDVTMPHLDGFETLEQIRYLSSVPVIILSARETSQDKTKGLELGADDYVAKPFDPAELIARIEAIRRRLEPDRESKQIESISFDHVTVDFNKHSVKVDGQEITLTRIEWLLISALARNAGKLMMYEELLNQIWGPGYKEDFQILRTWVSRLRRKIERDARHPEIIRNVAKTGYIMSPPTS